MDGPEVTAPAPAVNAAPAPVADGMVSVPQSDVDRYKGLESEVSRYKENIAGLTPWMENARAAGFNSPEEFSEAKSIYDAFPPGLNAASKAEYLRALGAGRTPEPKAEPEFDARAEFEKFTTESRFETAREKHGFALTRQNESFEKRMAEFLGEDASDELKFFWGGAGQQALQAAQNQTYEANHPLSGHDFMPLGDDGLDALFKSFDEKKTGFKAAQMAAAGDKANKPKSAKTVTPAGGGQGQGGPEPAKVTSTHGGIIGAARESAEAHLAKRQAARERAPMSSQG